MKDLIVQSKQIVTLVGGGEVSSPLLETIRSLAPTLVAADGGANHALRAGWRPDAVIGDLDSISDDARAQIPTDRLHRIAEQDSTDFEKCLTRIRAPLVLGLGFMGPRTDHQLAAFHSLMRCADRRCILIGAHQLVFLCPPELSFEATPGDLVSVFPLSQVAASSEGLEWPLDGVPLAPGQMVGTSNRASSARVRLICDQPGMLVILPGPALDAVLPALSAAGSQWPARAE
ncbi:MAG: thiamine diphosphokinase [Aestuariivita sp.]|uniref:thiamine diphosphokinase n=1 Tax=Aestuariivita sp. TaxID=1872407 RepID=UPI003BAE31F3